MNDMSIQMKNERVGKRSRTRAKHGFRLPVFLLPLLLLIGICSAVLYFYPNLRFIAADMTTALLHPGSLPEKVDASGYELCSYNLESLAEDSRVRLDASAMLVNEEHPLAEDYVAELTYYKDTDVQMNPLLVDSYAGLAAAVKDEFSQKLFISSSYRSHDEQVIQYENDSEVAAVPGASEHEAGLALDVYVKYYGGNGFIKSEAGQWVNRHCSDYGFIIRYPYYGKSSTGISYEPWHLRYVGSPHAGIMTENRLTMEKYYDFFEEGAFFSYGDYMISLQSGDEVMLPEEFDEAVVSEDNQGRYLVTWR